MSLRYIDHQALCGFTCLSDWRLRLLVESGCSSSWLIVESVNTLFCPRSSSSLPSSRFYSRLDRLEEPPFLLDQSSLWSKVLVIFWQLRTTSREAVSCLVEPWFGRRDRCQISQATPVVKGFLARSISSLVCRWGRWFFVCVPRWPYFPRWSHEVCRLPSPISCFLWVLS